MFLLIFYLPDSESQNGKICWAKQLAFLWNPLPIGLPRVWTSKTANQASPNSMVIPVGINAWSAGSQDLRMMSSNHSEIYGHWACRRQRNVGSCFVGKKKTWCLWWFSYVKAHTNVCLDMWFGGLWVMNLAKLMVFGPFAKWFMESQKAKIMSVIRCFFPSLVFIVTSKTTQKNGRTEHLPVHPDAKNGGDFNRRIRFFSCAKEFRASSKSLINSCLSSGLPHFKTMGVVGLLKRRGTMWRVKMYVKQWTQPQKMGCWMRESENNAFLNATTAIHLHS